MAWLRKGAFENAAKHLIPADPQIGGGSAKLERFGSNSVSSLMTIKKAIASAALLPWVITLGFISGPVRWELAHTLNHFLERSDGSLPLLTARLSLPVLGIAPFSPAAVITAILFWGITWLGLGGLFVLIWRARTREDLLDRVVFGGAFYAGCVLLLFTLAAIGLALPFLLL